MAPSKILFVAIALGALLLGTTTLGQEADPADLARGEDLFQLCAQCHGSEGGGDAATLAPAIAGMAPWYVEAQLRKFQQGYRGTHFDDIPGMRMRPISFTLMSRSAETGEMEPADADIAAVAAYAGSLPSVKQEPTLDGDAEAGKTLYGPCIACHAVDGAGNEALGGAPVRNQADWYLLRSLRGYKDGVRGWRSDDVQGSMMKGMVSTLPDEKTMKDVISYMLTLGSGAE